MDFRLFIHMSVVLTIVKSARRDLRSPCPNVFQYEKVDIPAGKVVFPSIDNPLWRGLVTIPGHMHNASASAQLKVTFSIPTVLPSKYVGKIEVRGGKSKALEGGFAELQYDVSFPKGVPVPYLNRIIFNGRIICNAILPRSPIQTKLILEHDLFPLRINLTSRNGEWRSGGDYAVVSNCGLFTPNNPLIVGGEPTSVGDWPWLVPIFLSTDRGLKFHCSGTLVDDTHIISAAHCFQGIRNPASLVAYIGKHNIRNWTDTNSQPRTIKVLTIHPDFDPHTLYSDVAILELEYSVTWSNNLSPACIWSGPDSLDLVVGRQGTIVGWGIDELNNTEVTSEPKAVVLPIISQETCLRSKKEYLFLTSNKTLCAGAKNGAGPCNGDSGGGLYLPIKGRWYLRGIISLSLLDSKTQKCDLYQYTVFTDIAKFQMWIKSNIFNN